MAILAGNDPIEVTHADHDGRVGRGYVLEFVSAQIALSAVDRMANAPQLRIRYCGDVFDISGPPQEALREMARQMLPSAPPRGPSLPPQ